MGVGSFSIVENTSTRPTRSLPTRQTISDNFNLVDNSVDFCWFETRHRLRYVSRPRDLETNFKRRRCKKRYVLSNNNTVVSQKYEKNTPGIYKSWECSWFCKKLNTFAVFVFWGCLWPERTNLMLKFLWTWFRPSCLSCNMGPCPWTSLRKSVYYNCQISCGGPRTTRGLERVS